MSPCQSFYKKITEIVVNVVAATVIAFLYARLVEFVSEVSKVK